MIAFKHLRQIMVRKDSKYTSHDFLNIHRYTEAYIKRVLFIGLRLNGVRYKESENIINATFIPTAGLIEKSLVLLSKSDERHSEVIKKLRLQYSAFFDLSDLLVKFSSKYRNWLAHGLIDELKDEELIDYLCYVNRVFVKLFEEFLKAEYGHSAFEKPSEWGATNGFKERIEDTAKRLSLGKVLNKPLTIEVVKKRLENIGFTNLLVE